MLDHRTRVACSEQNFMYFSLIVAASFLTISLFPIAFWLYTHNKILCAQTLLAQREAFCLTGKTITVWTWSPLTCFLITTSKFQVSKAF